MSDAERPFRLSRAVLLQLLAALVLLQGLTLASVEHRPGDDVRIGATAGVVVAMALLGRLLHRWAQRTSTS
jgi:hypothetical protein